MGSRRIKIFVWQGNETGGAEQVMRDIAAELNRHPECEVTVGMFADGVKHQRQAQIRIRRILPKKYVALNTFWACWKLRRALPDYDLVYVHTAAGWHRHAQRVAYHEPGDLDLLLRSLRPVSRILYWFQYRAALRELKNCHYAIAASNRASRFMDRHHIKPLLCSRNGTSTDLPFRAPKKQPPHLRVGFVGRDDRIKNFATVLEVFEHKKRQDVLYVYGFSGESTKNITYKGWVSPAELHNDMAERLDVLVVASHFEAFPLVIIEALAIGLPVIASRNALPHELKDECVCFDGTADGLAQALQRMRKEYVYWSARTIAQANDIRRHYNKNIVYQREVGRVLQAMRAGK